MSDLTKRAVVPIRSARTDGPHGRTGCTDARAARTDGELGELGAALEALEAGAPPEEPPMFTGIWNLLIVILKDAETPLQSAAP